jgi:hypothetical protein
MATYSRRGSLQVVGSVALGLLVVGQVLFLLAANGTDLAASLRKVCRRSPCLSRLAPNWVEGEGSVYRLQQFVADGTERWAELTGQPQIWAMFAPNVTDHVVFPAVELRWDEEWMPLAFASRRLAPLAAAHPGEAAAFTAAVTLTPPPPRPAPLVILSDNEPPDRQHFFKMGLFRLRRYEGNLDVFRSLDGQPFEAESDRWRTWIEEGVKEEWGPMKAYLRYRLTAFCRERPELPTPTQVILVARIYRIPAPPGPRPWDWEFLGAHRVARWQPWQEEKPADLPLEIYNPLVGRFENLAREPSP